MKKSQLRKLIRKIISEQIASTTSSAWLGTGDPNNPTQADFNFNTDCSPFNQIPQSFQDLICNGCDAGQINMQCECCNVEAPVFTCDDFNYLPVIFQEAICNLHCSNPVGSYNEVCPCCEEEEEITDLPQPQPTPTPPPPPSPLNLTTPPPSPRNLKQKKFQKPYQKQQLNPPPKPKGAPFNRPLRDLDSFN